MGLLDFLNNKPKVNQLARPAYSSPMELIARWMNDGQVVWFDNNAQGNITNGFLSNHIIFTIQDWKSSKVASAPPIVYEVKDETAYKKYRAQIQAKTDDSFRRSQDMKHKALSEVSDHDIQKVLDRPNPNMSRYEYEYGMQTYIDIVGAGYHMSVRDGVNPEEGAIKEMYLPPAHQMTLVSGNIQEPIKEWFLSSNPENKISAKNVCQIRNFSPRYETPTQWMYGLSRLFSAKSLIQKYADATTTEVSLFQSKGVRDFVFRKNFAEMEELTVEQTQLAEDVLNRKVKESGSGGIVFGNSELGTIRVGFSPTELGILDTLKDAKIDLCALYHIPAIIFDWNVSNSTFNNLSEARKIGLTDAVLPVLYCENDVIAKESVCDIPLCVIIKPNYLPIIHPSGADSGKNR